MTETVYEQLDIENNLDIPYDSIGYVLAGNLIDINDPDITHKNSALALVDRELTIIQETNHCSDDELEEIKNHIINGIKSTCEIYTGNNEDGKNVMFIYEYFI